LQTFKIPVLFLPGAATKFTVLAPGKCSWLRFTVKTVPFFKSLIIWFQMSIKMVDGAIQFTVDNGRGPITSLFKPENQFQFCNGDWHEIHGMHNNHRQYFTFFRYPKNGAESLLESQMNIKYDF
jgi:hypothetical protein